MQNGTGNTPDRSTQPYVTPEADLVVFAGTHGNRRAAALNTLTDGTPVIAAGMVDEAREHGDIDNPRVTLILVNDLGQATYAAADADVLDVYSMYLVDGVEVSLHGIARQPFAEDPKTTYIQIVKVERLFG